jgi:hypothetical protein
MKKIAGISLTVLCFAIVVTSASACGDKLLRVSRLYRHQAKAGNTTVLVYARPHSLLDNASSASLEKAFKEEGYKLLLVNGEREFTLALQSGAVDVVIADVADASQIGRLAHQTTPLVIPVVAKDDLISELDAKRYAAVIKSPAKPGKYLDAVDRAFDSKLAKSNPKLEPASLTAQ